MTSATFSAEERLGDLEKQLEAARAALARTQGHLEDFMGSAAEEQIATIVQAARAQLAENECLRLRDSLETIGAATKESTTAEYAEFVLREECRAPNNGRTDGHGAYPLLNGDGVTVCGYCRAPLAREKVTP